MVGSDNEWRFWAASNHSGGRTQSSIGVGFVSACDWRGISCCTRCAGTGVGQTLVGSTDELLDDEKLFD